MKRPLRATDPGIAKRPMVQDALAGLKSAGLGAGLFHEIKGNPVGKNVDDGVAAYRGGGHDGVIAFGGGSGLDCAKAIALMVGPKRPMWVFEDVGAQWKLVDTAGVAATGAAPPTAPP